MSATTLTTTKVTDARELRPKNRPQLQRQGTRVISVDNVLQFASEIPSAQKRERDRPRMHTRTPSGRHPLDPKLSGRGVPLAQSGGAVGVAGMTHLPARSSKTSEKLVLLPEADDDEGPEAFEEEEEDEGPPRDEELKRRRERLPGKGKSDAERLPKSQRQADPQLARVTAYCTAQSFKLRSTAQFVRDQHGAKTKLYDDVLYCVYQLPLLGGSDGYRVRSSPVVKNPGGRSILDEQIEMNEQRQYREGWMVDSDEYSVRGNEGYTSPQRPDAMERQRSYEHEHEVRHANGENTPYTNAGWNGEPEGERISRQSSDSSNALSGYPSPSSSINPQAYSVAELYIFSYGVAVFWNFTANQEKDLLADLTFSAQSANPNAPGGRSTNASGNTVGSSSISQKAAALAPASTSLPLMTRPLDEDDFETEEFHFQYDSSVPKPRIFNDMITLRTSDHMIKLAMSHAVAQSTKLSFFEERMQRTMTEAQYVPRRLALEGTLGMTRREVVSLVGRLFEGRVDVNLCESAIISPSNAADIATHEH